MQLCFSDHVLGSLSCQGCVEGFSKSETLVLSPVFQGWLSFVLDLQDFPMPRRVRVPRLHFA